MRGARAIPHRDPAMVHGTIKELTNYRKLRLIAERILSQLTSRYRREQKRATEMLENAMLILIIVANISLLFTLLRLSIKHRELLSQLRFGRSVYGFIDTLARLMEFIFKRRYAKLSDPLLTLSCISFILSFFASVPLMLLAIVFHR
jgi:hypothetical protein